MRQYDHRSNDDEIRRIKERRALLWRMEEEYEAHEEKEAVQASSLEIGASDDLQEQHADAVAKKVVSGENAAGLLKNQPAATTMNTSQEKGGSLMAKSEDGTLKGTEQLQAGLDSSKGGGSTLEPKLQAEMGEKMGADLSDVKIHTDGKAHEMSEGINAKAFTHGQDIYFKQGNFDTSSNEGKELLAHELTHTQQQKDGLGRKVQRSPEKYKAGDNLQSIWFKDVPELESAFDGDLVFGLGSAGLYVQRIQLALLKLQEVMRWTDETGKKFLVNLGPAGDDGIFGNNTYTSLVAVQGKLGLEPDGEVGSETMQKLDELFWKRKQLPVSYNKAREEEKIQQAIPKAEYYSEGRMGATEATYSDILSTGKKIYDQPGGKEKFRIKYGEKLSIYSYFDEWYEIGYDGKLGWVQKDYVKDPMPLDDNGATLYFVQPGEQLGEIVQKHYKSISESCKDARLLSYAVANANVGRTGVTIDIEKGKNTLSWGEKVLLDDNSEKAQAIWRTIQVVAGTNIWLPSESKIYEMDRDGLITSGSMFEDLMEDLEVLAYFIFGFLEGVVQSIVDLFVGLYELGELAVKAVKLFSSPVELAKMWTYLQSLNWDEVLEAIKAIPGAIWDDFVGKWNSPVRTEAAEFRGKVIGYIVAEIVLAIFTAGIFTEVKWVSFVLSKLGKAGELILEIMNGVRKVIGKNPKLGPVAKVTKAGIKFNFKALIIKYERHIFSKDHIDKGILDLGKDKNDILNSIESVVNKNLNNLKEGDNFMLQKMNGHESTVKAFVRNGEVISIDAYKGYPTRTFGNIIQ